jgi:hypothetical protein
MAKAKRSKTKRPPNQKPARGPRAPAAGINKQLTAQNRRLLGKHYANKYRVGS